MCFILSGCQQKPLLNKIIGTDIEGFKKTFTVLPNNDWVDTGIVLKSGQLVTISASGKITVEKCNTSGVMYPNALGSTFTPSGSFGTALQTYSFQGWLFDQIEDNNRGNMAYTYGLIACTADSQSIYKRFFLGNNFKSSEMNGKLYLGVNTMITLQEYQSILYGPDVCSGSFNVTISVE